ncbi:MAG: hypothetical protein ABEJ05_09630 [Haloglomus sp.]
MSDGDSSDLRSRLPGNRPGGLAVAAAGALCLLVAGVGLVALAAEFSRSWGAYFVMERVVAAATPAAVVLAGALLLAGLAAVAGTPRR